MSKCEWKEVEYKLETPNGEYERGTTPCPKDEDIKVMSGFCTNCSHFEGAFPSKEIIRCTFKPEPKAPTHIDIMTKWFREGNNTYVSWNKVFTYFPETKLYGLLFKIDLKQDFKRSFVSKEWFAGRTMADIPPETTE